MAATLIRLVPKVKVENRGLFSSHTGTVYIFELESEDGAFSKKFLFTADAATASHFNTGTNIGDLLFDLETPMTYVKTGATTWAEIGDVT